MYFKTFIFKILDFQHITNVFCFGNVFYWGQLKNYFFKIQTTWNEFSITKLFN